MPLVSPNYIYFGLKGHFDPAEVASEIGLAPTKSLAENSKDAERRAPRCSILRFAQTHAERDAVVLDVYELADKVVE